MPPLGAEERAGARRRLLHIIDHFEDAETQAGRSRNANSYNRPALVRLTYEHSLSEESQDLFLRAFFQSMALSMTGEDVNFSGNAELEGDLRSTLFGFADYLLDNFFLPLKASTKKTPQPSPAYHSAVQRAQGGEAHFAGTPERLSALRGACLVRDRHRCVISRHFDRREAMARLKRGNQHARDDDGVPFGPETTYSTLEVAHILPHSLVKSTANPNLTASRQAALTILNMFDSGVGHLIEGSDIDRPRNAFTIAADLHQGFGDFQIYFDATEQAHTYRIRTFMPPELFAGVLPVTRALYLTPNRTIDPPSPRLLAIHRAVAHILHLSAAGEYIDKILKDMEDTVVGADGSTELGRLVQLGLFGWMQSTVDA